jgi:hypothetical protein
MHFCAWQRPELSRRFGKCRSAHQP